MNVPASAAGTRLDKFLADALGSRAAAERAKNASIHTIAAAVTTTTIAVAPANSPKAIPVF